MCHGSDVLPGQSAISDSDLLLDSTFCEKNKQVSQFFGTVCLLSSPTGMDQMSHSASQRFRTQIYCWTVPSVEKNRFPSFFVPWTYCSVQEPWIRMSHPAASWVTSVKKKQTKRNGACMCSAKYFFKLYVYIFFWCFVCRSKPLTPTGKTNNTHMLNFSQFGRLKIHLFPLWLFDLVLKFDIES